MINSLEKDWFKVESSGNDEISAKPFHRYRLAIRTKSRIAEEISRYFKALTRNLILSCYFL